MLEKPSSMLPWSGSEACYAPRDVSCRIHRRPSAYITGQTLGAPRMKSPGPQCRHGSGEGARLKFTHPVFK